MQDSFDALLNEADYARGIRGVTSVWNRVLFDWIVSLASAYRDEACRSGRMRWMIASLLGLSTGLWILIAHAALGNHSIGAWLDQYTTVNTTLAFGAPSLALLLSWLAMPRAWQRPPDQTRLFLFRASSAFASFVWILLVSVRLSLRTQGV